jgi:radical SAM superfamily enzyme YgiQ (UPF0313 family)
VLRAGTFADTRGVSVAVVDEQLETLEHPMEPPGAWLSRYQPDIVGVQVCTSSLRNGLNLLRMARARFPGVLTVLGGPGVASAGEQLFNDGDVDAIVLGEGEVTFSELVCAFAGKREADLSGMPGLIFRGHDGLPERTPKRQPIRHLDMLPFPARDLVDMRSYRRISKGRAGNLITSRGCSYACAYCYSKHQWGVGQRRFSVSRVIEEIRIMVEDYGFDRIRIEDDDFLESTEWVTEFCNRLIELNLNTALEWEAKARPDHMDPEMLALMRRSGCFRLLMGVETLDPALLARLSRPLQIAVLERALNLLRRHAIGVQATVILGIPGETAEAMRYTLNWLEERLKGNHDITSPCFFVPFYSEIGDAMQRKLPFTVDVQMCKTVTSTPATSPSFQARLVREMSWSSSTTI